MAEHNTPEETKKITIRPATVEDCDAIYKLIVELAEYEKEPLNHIKIDGNNLREDLKAGFFRCNLAMDGPQICGMAFYHFSYSTWVGKCLYLEDLYVKPSHRRLGIGKLFFKAFAKKADTEGFARLQWICLTWNDPAKTFYEKKVGAKHLKRWELWRLDKQSLQKILD